MRVVFAHALRFLHVLHSHAFTCITTALQLRSLIAFRCMMQYLHFLHFARDCISLHYAIFAIVAFARDIAPFVALYVALCVALAEVMVIKWMSEQPLARRRP